jgi:hypothetical protein
LSWEDKMGRNAWKKSQRSSHSPNPYSIRLSLDLLSRLLLYFARTHTHTHTHIYWVTMFCFSFVTSSSLTVFWSSCYFHSIGHNCLEVKTSFYFLFFWLLCVCICVPVYSDVATLNSHWQGFPNPGLMLVSYLSGIPLSHCPRCCGCPLLFNCTKESLLKLIGTFFTQFVHVLWLLFGSIFWRLLDASVNFFYSDYFCVTPGMSRRHLQECYWIW